MTDNDIALFKEFITEKHGCNFNEVASNYSLGGNCVFRRKMKYFKTALTDAVKKSYIREDEHTLVQLLARFGVKNVNSVTLDIQVGRNRPYNTTDLKPWHELGFAFDRYGFINGAEAGGYIIREGTLSDGRKIYYLFDCDVRTDGYERRH